MPNPMPNPTKPKKIGRPKLPKGEAKGKIVPIRFAPEDLKAITAAAKARKTDTFAVDTEHVKCRNPGVRISS